VNLEDLFFQAAPQTTTAKQSPGCWRKRTCLSLIATGFDGVFLASEIKKLVVAKGALPFSLRKDNDRALGGDPL